jgi:two-component system, OmpR family, phosphate regulon sensor histidine kinase PhoR
MPDWISKRICETFVTALSDAALIVDHQNTIIAANGAACDLLSSGLVGHPVTLFLRSPDLHTAISETLQSSNRQQVELIVRSRIQRTLDVHLAPLDRGENGSLALVVLRDRTREEQIERMRTDFVANASHELRTPLTTLSGFIDTMQGAASKDEKARGEFLKVMKAQADRMSLLIDDLLSLSRIELDEHVPPNTSVNLVDIVYQITDLLQTMVQESGCFLQVDLPQHLNVRGESSQLAQVVHNLIENAIKYSGQGKRVTVTGHVEGKTAMLNVTDDGPGIAPHHIPRLTERFYRVNVQDSRMRGGTGLGLAICKHIINRHRGALTVRSEVGKGSTFSLQLPAAVG